MDMDVVVKKHCDLSEKEWNDIAGLKDQHWPHGAESQKKWIAQNYEKNDVHILLYQDETPVAYSGLNELCCMVDGQEKEVLGLGGVCVAKNRQKEGLGKRVVECVNCCIAEAQKPGLLLCHEELTHFYTLCGWKVMHCEKVSVAGADFAHFVMCCGDLDARVECLAIPKNF